MFRTPSLLSRLTTRLLAWLLNPLLGATPAPSRAPSLGARKFAYAHASTRHPRTLEGEWRRLEQDGRQDW